MLDKPILSAINLVHEIQQALNAIPDTPIHTKHFRTSYDLAAFVSSFDWGNQWSFKDIQALNDTLDDAEAQRLLNIAMDRHDATIGINWEFLQYIIDEYGIRPDGQTLCNECEEGILSDSHDIVIAFDRPVHKECADRIERRYCEKGYNVTKDSDGNIR